MTIEMNMQDRGVLYGMLAELGGDIVVRTDIAGYIEHASVELDQLGFAVSDMLIAPHLADLAADDHAEPVRAYCEQAIRGTCAIRSPSGENAMSEGTRSRPGSKRRLQSLVSQTIKCSGPPGP